ncbi:MAG: nitrilase-related carbon-nitrogen hydrolase [Bacillota bacterium]
MRSGRLHQFVCQPLVLGLLSGVLLALAARVPGAWPLSFIALVPAYIAVAQAPSGRVVFLSGFVTGLPMMGAAIWWLFDALPLPPAFGTIPPWLGLATVGTSFVILTLAFAAVVGLWALFSYAIRAWRYGLLAMALSWLAFEYLRMVVYNLLTFAPHIDNAPFFSSGFVGYPLADSMGWVQLAAVGGVYTLGTVVVLGNALAYRIVRSRQRRVASGIAMALIILLVHVVPIAAIRSAAFPDMPRHRITVAALSLRTPANADPEVRVPVEATMVEFVRRASDAGADLIALPEESNFLAPFSTRTPNSVLGDRHRSAIIDSGTALLEDGTRVRRAQAPDTLGFNTGLLQDKRILTPKGEYLPTLLSGIITTLGGGQYLDRFAAKRNYSIGKVEIPGTIAGVKFSVLLCIETMEPGLGREVVRAQGSEILAVLASHAWFGTSPFLIQDTFRQARIQAVEAHVPVVRSADFAPAYVFDAYGRVVASGGFGPDPDLAVATLSIP